MIKCNQAIIICITCNNLCMSGKWLVSYVLNWIKKLLNSNQNNKSEQIVRLIHFSCVQLFQPHGLYTPWNSPDQNTGVGSHSLLQGIFPTQGLNPGLPHCRQILYQLSHKESLPESCVHGIFQARMLECVARGPSRSMDGARVSCSGRRVLYRWGVRCQRAF